MTLLINLWMALSLSLFAGGYIQVNGKKTYIKEVPPLKNQAVNKPTSPTPPPAQASSLLKPQPKAPERQTQTETSQESSPGFIESMINRGKAKWQQMQKEHPPTDRDNLQELEEQM